MKIIVVILIAIFITGCSAVKYDNYEYIERNAYINKQGYKYWYELDSIIINNPIIVYSKKGGRFVMSQGTLDKYNGKQSFFLDRPDVFLYEDFFSTDMHLYISKKFVENISLADCSIKLVTDIKIKGIKYIYRFTNNPYYFKLFLMRGDFYQNKFSILPDVINKKENLPNINFKNKKYHFYKLAIPICKTE